MSNSLSNLTQRVNDIVNQKGLNESIKFDLGEDGIISIEPSSEGAPTVHNNDTTCSTIISISLDDLASLLEGELSASTAFMMGKIRVDGDMGKAMELARAIK